MAQVQMQPPTAPAHIISRKPFPGALRTRFEPETRAPVNQNGSFEADRVLKSGYVQKRTQKTKSWKTIFLVLRPNRLSIYKTDKEDKLRHQLHLSDLTAVAFLKDPKHKRENVFGLFSPSRNFHFQAPSQQEAESWVDLIRREARIEEEEEEMFLASPLGRRQTPSGMRAVLGISEGMLSSSPEPITMGPPLRAPINGRRKSSQVESSGLSGTELASHSDFSDNDGHRLPGASIESLNLHSPKLEARSMPTPGSTHMNGINRSLSHLSVQNLEQDLERVIWQGWLSFLRIRGGVRQWKRLWGVLRPRNLILYKDSSEYTAQRIFELSSIVNVVDIDPLSRSKANCLQLITEEKSYKFCAADEESLVQCIGAFKSLLAKRRELELRAAAVSQDQQYQKPKRQVTN